MKVYLSYAQADVEKARILTKHLSEAGLDVWFAERRLLPGENAHAVMGKALASADAFVALLSPEAGKTPNVRSDILFALMGSRFEGRLIPVFLRPTTDFPWI